ncbi:endonuclease/reverse transcriptase, partial [Golovinomyces cichoracearum]
QGVTSFIEKELDVTSDHSPLLICIPTHLPYFKPNPKLRFSTIDEEMFKQLLRMQLVGMNLLEEKSSSHLENRAEELVDILQLSFAGSAKKSLTHNKGQPWWNQSCRNAKKKYKKILHQRTPSQDDKKAYRKVINKEKANFFQKKLDEACNAKEAFEISKWHKSKGQF